MNGPDRARIALRALALVAVGTLAASCSSSKQAAFGCPRVITAPGTDKIVLFGPNGHEAKDVKVYGQITDLDFTCKRQKTGVAVNAEIKFYGERAGPQITDATFPYFVALVDPNQHVVTQEAYQFKMEFLPGESYRRMPAEKVTVHLPLRKPTDANDYRIVVGFQLTPDQLAFNRTARPQPQP